MTTRNTKIMSSTGVPVASPSVQSGVGGGGAKPRKSVSGQGVGDTKSVNKMEVKRRDDRFASTEGSFRFLYKTAKKTLRSTLSNVSLANQGGGDSGRDGLLKAQATLPVLPELHQGSTDSLDRRHEGSTVDATVTTPKPKPYEAWRSSFVKTISFHQDPTGQRASQKRQSVQQVFDAHTAQPQTDKSQRRSFRISDLSDGMGGAGAGSSRRSNDSDAEARMSKTAFVSVNEEDDERQGGGNGDIQTSPKHQFDLDASAQITTLRERVFALTESRWSPSRNSPPEEDFLTVKSLLMYLHRAAGIYTSIAKNMIATLIVLAAVRVTDEVTDGAVFHDRLTEGLLSIFTGVLGFTLVFRINLAYARWWDSRRSCEAFAVKWYNVALLSSVFDEFSLATPRAHYKYRCRIAGVASILHAEALKELGNMTELQNLGAKLLDPAVTERCLCDGSASCVRNGVSQGYVWMAMLLVGRFNQHLIPSPILTRLYALLDDGMSGYYEALLIRTTPFPYPFTQIINMGLTLVMILVPTLVHSLSPNFIWAAITSQCCVFGFFALAQVASELEDPFGTDFYDHPLETWQIDFDLELMDLIRKTDFMVPSCIIDASDEDDDPNAQNLTRSARFALLVEEGDEEQFLHGDANDKVSNSGDDHDVDSADKPNQILRKNTMQHPSDPYSNITSAVDVKDPCSTYHRASSSMAARRGTTVRAQKSSPGLSQMDSTLSTSYFEEDGIAGKATTQGGLLDEIMARMGEQERKSQKQSIDNFAGCVGGRSGRGGSGVRASTLVAPQAHGGSATAGSYTLRSLISDDAVGFRTSKKIIEEDVDDGNGFPRPRGDLVSSCREKIIELDDEKSKTNRSGDGKTSPSVCSTEDKKKDHSPSSPEIIDIKKEEGTPTSKEPGTTTAAMSPVSKRAEPINDIDDSSLAEASPTNRNLLT